MSAMARARDRSCCVRCVGLAGHRPHVGRGHPDGPRHGHRGYALMRVGIVGRWGHRPLHGLLPQEAGRGPRSHRIVDAGQRLLARKCRLGVSVEINAACRSRAHAAVAQVDAAPRQPAAHQAILLAEARPMADAVPLLLQPRRPEAGIAALAALNEVTMERYDELAADGVQFEFSESGLLMAYHDFDEAEATRKEVELVAAAGFTSGTGTGASSQAAAGTASCHELNEAELYEREPMLRPGFRFGLFLDEGRHVRPESVTAGLASSLRASGVEIHEAVTATGFRERETTRDRDHDLQGRTGGGCRGTGGRCSHGVPEPHGRLPDPADRREGLLGYDRAAHEPATSAPLAGWRHDRDESVQGRAALRRDDGTVRDQPPDGRGAESGRFAGK